jgi:hypothetical protein
VTFDPCICYYENLVSCRLVVDAQLYILSCRSPPCVNSVPRYSKKELNPHNRKQNLEILGSFETLTFFPTNDTPKLKYLDQTASFEP